MIQKKTLYGLYGGVFILLFGLFFLQFSIREEKDQIQEIQKKTEKNYDENQILKEHYSALTSSENLQKLQKELFPNYTSLAGEKE
ncbi:MAG: hypothetical protein JXR30_04145 [Alphaproteobacteria bacterium]|nr:hypothetical protein [Alphaproteobacteria bacterium]